MIEEQITSSVDEIAGSWIAAELQQDQARRERYGAQIERFKEWASACGLELPVSGHIVAGYLLEMAASGETLPALAEAAKAIVFAYEVELMAYLNRQPIHAVLSLIAAQTSANRVLN
jgi:hypothetical protein